MKTNLGILFVWLSLASGVDAKTHLPESLIVSPQSYQMQVQEGPKTLWGTPSVLTNIHANLASKYAPFNSTAGIAEKNTDAATDSTKISSNAKPLLTSDQIKELAEIEMQRMRDLHAHEKWQIEHIHQTYASQATISRALFWALSVMTLLSLTLCLYQFAQGMRHMPQQATDKAGTSNTTQIEISANSFKLQSNTMGILLLAFTLAFFYLLVKEVYPISVGP